MLAYPRLLICIITLSMVATGWSSMDNEEVGGLAPTGEALFVDCNTLSFLKNNEYFGPYLVGHTFAGYQLQPHLKYATSSGVITKLGVWLQQDWASKKFFSQHFPTFTVQYQSGATALLIGTLDGMDQHRLLRPLCDTERMLTQAPETGLRIHHNSSQTTFVDLWLHWLTLLDTKNNIPEELLAGFSCEQLLAKVDRFTIHLPLQVLVYHRGGQGIDIKDYSLWMGAVGGRMNLHIGEYSFLRDCSLGMYYVANQYVKKPKRPVQRGHGLYGEFTYATAWLTFQIGYWYTYGFTSENLGHPLYQTHVGTEYLTTPQNLYRHLIFLHIIGTYHLTNALTFVVHVDPYYDLKHQLLEHEAGLYLRYNLSFQLLDREKKL